MRKVLFVFLLAVSCSVVSLGQERTKVEVFGGYQYTNVSDGFDRFNFNGWNTAIAVYGTKNNWVGLTADFSGAYGSPFDTTVRLHNYLFGPTFRFSLPKVTPYAHALIGVSHFGADAPLSTTDQAFAYAFGGGLDLGASKHIAIRLGQLDYLGTRFKATDFGTSNQNHFRYSTGVVFKF